jgi:ankyrin repeat protein
LTAVKGHHKIVQLLLDRGADVNARGGQALRRASMLGQERTVQLLLDRGALPNARTKSSSTALQGVLECSYRELVGLLNEGLERVTALESTSLKGYHKIVQLLLEKGADTDFPGGKWLDTLRAGQWNVRKVQRILQSDPFLSIEPLLSAMFDTDSQAERIVRVMLPYLTLEAAEQRQYWPCATLLHHAAFCGSVMVTERCLDLKVDVRAPDEDGVTALHYAARRGNLVVVRMLVRAGSNIKALDRDGQTPLENAQDRASQMSTENKTETEMPIHDVVKYLSGQAQAESTEPRTTPKHRERRSKEERTDKPDIKHLDLTVENLQKFADVDTPLPRRQGPRTQASRPKE